jgi:hypothetical protein
MAEWQGSLMDLHYTHGKRKHESEDTQDYFIKEREIALKHDDTGAVVKLTDDGFIDIFADEQLGVRFDPVTKSINLFGDNINVIAQNFNVKTRPDGFTWNGKAFNSAIQQDENIMKTLNNPIRYSEGMVTIMQELGLPVEQVSKEDS